MNVFNTIKDKEVFMEQCTHYLRHQTSLIDAYESVTKNSMFWIVISNEDIATKLIGEIDSRVD